MGQWIVNKHNKLVALLRDRTGRDVEVGTAGLKTTLRLQPDFTSNSWFENKPKITTDFTSNSWSENK